MARVAVFRLLYVSTALVPPDQVAHAIFDVSRRDNLAAGITGCLLYTRQNYAQVLEGDEEAVTTLIGRIASDPRHHQLHIVAARRCEDRSYGKWAMGRASGTHLQRFVWEIAQGRSQSSVIETELLAALVPEPDNADATH